MPLEELDCFVEKYNTRVFNIHSPREYPLNYDYSKYKDLIYLENTRYLANEEELSQFSGICFDTSHLEEHSIAGDSNYGKNFENLAKKYPVGCCHVSAIKDSPRKDIEEFDDMEYSAHYLGKLSELDYVKKYLDYLPDIISIELENSFEEQLKVKEYLEKIINN